MNEEIEYAEMLEIPVSTVNVVRKSRRRKKTSASPARETPAPLDLPLKDSVIAQVNDRLGEPSASAENTDLAEPTAELPDPLAVEEGHIDFDPVPERIDTVRLYAAENKRGFFERFRLRKTEYTLDENTQNEGGRYEFTDETRSSRAAKIAIRAEFAIACVLCGTIFLTNVFMPESGVNTFFRALATPETETVSADNRVYSDFELSPIVSENSNAVLTLSDDGVLSIQDKCCVYPAADGEVAKITETDGLYTLTLQYSDSFTGVFSGLNYVYYAVGEEVKANVPVGYSDGETEVQVTMYSGGEALNCFRLTEENCLAWTQS